MSKFKIGDKVLYSLDVRQWRHEVRGIYPGTPTEYWIKRIGAQNGEAEGRVEEKNLSPAIVQNWDEESI
jgi:hypothetical protein